MGEPLRVREKPIFADWLAAFPLLKRHKGGRRLLRIYDPVVFGIELRKFSAWGGPQYRPEFVAMSLLTHWSGFGINEEAYDRRHLQLHIYYDDHPQKREEAIEALRAGFPLLSAAGVDEQAMVDLHRSSCRQQEARGEDPLSNWGALVQILRYYGRLEECAAEQQELLAFASAYPLHALYPCKSFAEYEQRFTTEVAVPLDVLLARRAERLAKGRWDKLPGVALAGRTSATGDTG